MEQTSTAEIVMILFIVLIFVAPITLAIGMKYYSHCRKAEIYNNAHNTEYTCGDFFWAKDQIQQNRRTLNVEGINTKDLIK